MFTLLGKDELKIKSSNISELYQTSHRVLRRTLTGSFLHFQPKANHV